MNQVVDQKAAEVMMKSHSSNDRAQSFVSSRTVHQNSISDGGQSSSASLSCWSDQRLWNCCRYYGEQARKWRNRFAGLLPEVHRRRLFERRGFGSIFEFAKKLAGVTEKSVRRILNLEKRFEEMPELRELLIQGLVSPHKLSRIASIATPENQNELSDKVRMFSKAVIETMVKDVKSVKNLDCTFPGNGPCDSIGIISAEDYKRDLGQIALFETKNDDKNVPGHRFYLDCDIEQELFELQEKGIDINAFLRDTLLKRRRRIEEEKARISREVQEKYIQKMRKKMVFEEHEMNRGCSAEKANEFSKNPDSRRIPAAILRLLRQEYGTKCSIPTCQKLSKNHHHLQRFSVAPIHDPYFIAPLCSEHHTLAHGSDVKFVEIRSKYG